MPYDVVRTLGSTGAISAPNIKDEYPPHIKRGMVSQADGSLVHLVVDINSSALTPVNGVSPGGDGSNTMKLYLYEELPGNYPQGNTYTLKATLATANTGWTTATTFPAHHGASMVADDQGHLHITFFGWNKIVYYVKATLTTTSGVNSYAFGTIETVYSNATAYYPLRCDIDVTGSGGTRSPVVITQLVNSTLTGEMVLIRGRVSSNSTWTTLYTPTTSPQFSVEDVSIAIIRDGNTTGTLIFTQNRYTTIGDIGDVTRGIAINWANMTVTAQGGFNYIPTLPNNKGFREYWAFALQSSTLGNVYLLAGVSGINPVAVAAAVVQVNATTGATTYLMPWTLMAYSQAAAANSNWPQGWCAVTLDYQMNVYFHFLQRRFEFPPGTNQAPTGGLVVGPGGNTVYQGTRTPPSYVSPAVVVGHFINNAGNWSFTADPWTTYPILGQPGTDSLYETARYGTEPVMLTGGSHHMPPPVNASTGYAATPGTVGMMYGTGRWSAGVVYVSPPAAPVAGTPAAGSVLTSSTPTLTAFMRENVPRPAAPQSVKFRVGTQSKLSPPATPLDADVNPILNRSPVSVLAQTTWASDGSHSRFAQNTTYTLGVSASSVFGTSTESTITFTVSHIPATSAVSPTGGAPLLAGAEQFIYTFSDPDPNDFETAHQIDVRDPSTSNTVVSTGKVALSQYTSPGVANPSFTRTATVVIPVASRDIPLQWRAIVWDSDDVASPASPWTDFVSSTPPAPAITFPTTADVTTGIPTVTWTPGIAGVKTAASRRVILTQSGNILYDSGNRAGSGNSLQIPASILQNNNYYTISVIITDSAGQTGSASVTFKTAWVIPISPSVLYCHLYEYARRGYVYVGWSNATIDANFQYWTLYRRNIRDGIWNSLGQFGATGQVNGYRDYTPVPTNTYEYAVTQTVNRFGDLLEGAMTNITRVSPTDDSFWLIDSANLVEALKLYGVTADKFTEDEYEENTYTVIGRGRHTDRGQRLGDSGSLSMSLKPRMRYFAGANRNLVLNPSAACKAIYYLPDGYVTTVQNTALDGPVLQGPITYLAPAPHGRTTVQRYQCNIAAATAGRYFQIDIPLDVSQMTVSGLTLYTSIWLATFFDKTAGTTWDPTAQVRMYVTWYDNTGTSLGVTSTSNYATNIGSYTPGTNNPDMPGAQAQLFTRWGTSMLVPATVAAAVSATLSIRFTTSNTGAPPDFAHGGTQVELNGFSEYIDGTMPGVQWAAVPDASSSYTDGYVQPGEQRVDINYMRDLGRDLYLRDPYGKLLLVHLGAPSVDRQPGVGMSEQTTAELTYFEVG